MDLRNCRQCGKVFVFKGKMICPACLEEEETEYELVRAYLVEHPGDGIAAVVEATGVSEARILQFFREGRLEAKKGAGPLLCEICGTPVAEGRICPKCLSRLRNEAQGLERKAHSTPEDARMYTANRLRGTGTGNKKNRN